MTAKKTELSALPQDAELEKSVLGVFMLEGDAYALYGESLTDDCFHSDITQTVYKAIFSLFAKGHAIDLLTVVQQLECMKTGMTSGELASHCMRFTRDVIGATHMDIWVKRLVELKIARRLIKMSYETIGKIEANGDVFDIHDHLQNQLVNVISENIHDQQSGMAAFVKESITDAERAANNQGVVGINTDFDFIDRNVLGLVNPDVTVIAARPGMGKTSLMLNIAGNIAQRGIPVGIFSFEMKGVQLVNKIFSQYIPAEVNKIRSGRLEEHQWQKLYKGADGIGKLPIYIEDSGSLTIEKVKAITKTWIIKHGVKVVFIDYLQLITPSPETRGGNREMHVSHIARQIKLVAMECNIPVVALSQMSREGGKEDPELHHLRSSGEIEQSADNVLFLNKNEVRTKELYPGYVEGDPEWCIDFLLKKCRLGSIGRRTLIFNAAHNQFREIRAEMYVLAGDVEGPF